jgi:hypothetical protein
VLNLVCICCVSHFWLFRLLDLDLLTLTNDIWSCNAAHGGCDRSTGDVTPPRHLIPPPGGLGVRVNPFINLNTEMSQANLIVTDVNRIDKSKLRGDVNSVGIC